MGDRYDLGPKPVGYAQLPPIAPTSTATYCRDLVTLSRISAILGKKQEADKYAAEAQEVKVAFNRDFFSLGPATTQREARRQTRCRWRWGWRRPRRGQAC